GLPPAGIGDERINPTKTFHRACEKLLHLRLFGEVGFYHKSFNMTQLALQRSDVGSISMIMEDERRAFGGERARNSGADASGSAGYQHDFTRQFRIHACSAKRSCRKPGESRGRRNAGWCRVIEARDSILPG